MKFINNIMRWWMSSDLWKGAHLSVNFAFKVEWNKFLKQKRRFKENDPSSGIIYCFFLIVVICECTGYSFVTFQTIPKPLKEWFSAASIIVSKSSTIDNYLIKLHDAFLDIVFMFYNITNMAYVLKNKIY